MAKPKPKKVCKRCGWRRSVPVGYFVFVPGVAFFSIDLAELIIRKRPRDPVALSPKQIGKLVPPDNVEAAHVPHVDAALPGILARVSHVRGVSRVLIDGRHRATKALYQGRAFMVYPLTRLETDACIVYRATARGKAR